jgi:hypothetical protein
VNGRIDSDGTAAGRPAGRDRPTPAISAPAIVSATTSAAAAAINFQRRTPTPWLPARGGIQLLQIGAHVGGVLVAIAPVGAQRLLDDARQPFADPSAVSRRARHSPSRIAARMAVTSLPANSRRPVAIS